jgi:lipoprotein-anchoring transpeptidase ErfK/SrfK
MKKLGIALALTMIVALLPAAASASVTARISLSQQRMYVSVDGIPRYTWAVSTARKGYRTPVGSFRPQRLERMWYSRKYDMSPMPHSVFFRGGYAIHGTNYVKSLGRPASHGCVRLAPGNAAALYSLVRKHGMGGTRIIITR